MKKIELKVEGMHCEGCEKRIINSLSSRNGFLNVKANHEDGTVLIEVEDEITKEEVASMMEDIGFEVVAS